MNELLTGVGIVHEAGEVAAGVNWDRVLLLGIAVIGAAVKLLPVIWPWIEPYIMPPIAALVDSVAKYRKS